MFGEIDNLVLLGVMMYSRRILPVITVFCYLRFRAVMARCTYFVLALSHICKALLCELDPGSCTYSGDGFFSTFSGTSLRVFLFRQWPGLNIGVI